MSRTYFNFRNITLTLSTGFFVYILTNVDWNLFGLFVHKLDLTILLLLVINFLVAMAFRSMRFSVSLPYGSRPSFKTIYKVAMRHNFYLSVLPARLGELYYIKLLSFNLEIPKRYSILSIVTCRLYDVVIVCVLGLYTLYYALNVQDQTLPIVLSIVILVVILLLIFLRTIIALLRGLIILCTRILPRRFKKRVADFASTQIPNLEHFSQVGHQKLFVTSILICVSMSFNYWLVLYMFGTNLSIFDVVFVFTIINLTNLLPVQTIGGFGLRESALIFALISIGMEGDTATALAVISRLILFFISTVVSALFLATKIDNKLPLPAN